MADRRKLGAKDMAVTMAVVLVVVGLIALYGRNVSFAPGAATQGGEIPTAEVIGGFQHARGTMSFPVTVPEGIPGSWHPNSFSVSDPAVSNLGVTAVGTLAAVRGGWITDTGAFIQLVEAAGTVNDVVTSEFGDSRPVLDTVQAGGSPWTVTTGVREETAWLRSVDDPAGMTTFLITGNAPEADFRVLADAVSAAG